MSFRPYPIGNARAVVCDKPKCKAGLGNANGNNLPPLPPGWKEVAVEHEGKTVKKHYCLKHQPPQQSL